MPFLSKFDLRLNNAPQLFDLRLNNAQKGSPGGLFVCPFSDAIFGLNILLELLPVCCLLFVVCLEV